MLYGARREDNAKLIREMAMEEAILKRKRQEKKEKQVISKDDITNLIIEMNLPSFTF